MQQRYTNSLHYQQYRRFRNLVISLNQEWEPDFVNYLLENLDTRRNKLPELPIMKKRIHESYRYVFLLLGMGPHNQMQQLVVDNFLDLMRQPATAFERRFCAIRETWFQLYDMYQVAPLVPAYRGNELLIIRNQKQFLLEMTSKRAKLQRMREDQLQCLESYI